MHGAPGNSEARCDRRGWGDGTTGCILRGCRGPPRVTAGAAPWGQFRRCRDPLREAAGGDRCGGARPAAAAASRAACRGGCGRVL